MPAFSYTQSIKVDPRWSLTVPDSMVHGPYPDFLRMATLRTVSDDMLREIRLEAITRSDQVRLLNSANEKLKERVVLVTDQRDLCVGDNARLQGEIVSKDLVIAKQRPWATIGKVGTVVVGVGVAAVVVTLVRDSLKDKDP